MRITGRFALRKFQWNGQMVARRGRPWGDDAWLSRIRQLAWNWRILNFGLPKLSLHRLRVCRARVTLELLFAEKIQSMPNATPLEPLRKYILLIALLPMLGASAGTASAQGGTNIIPKLPQGGGEVTLEADRQGGEIGKTYYADGNVDLRYQNMRLRADHVEWNEETDVVTARGHVQLDYLTQHL
jgi:hypothetical protein